jgi:hypothetical protein
MRLKTERFFSLAARISIGDCDCGLKIHATHSLKLFPTFKQTLRLTKPCPASPSYAETNF